MQGFKEILDLLTKAKDIRLNIAIFVVSLAILACTSKDLVEIDPVTKKFLRGLVFITLVRLVYSLIGLIYSSFQNRQKEKVKLEKAAENARNAESESLKNRENIRSAFKTLDIFQLYIIQELKRQNHVQIKKGAPLFTLKSLKIIYTPAIGEHYESASLTTIAKDILDNELWRKFDEIKFNSLVRFFEGIQAEDARYFQEFLSRSSIKTKRLNRTSTGSQYYDNERIFSSYSKSIIFAQPQRNYTYVIDPMAKSAIETVFTKKPEESNG
ncbi:hypothetical protein [uncultured Kushneria sp.]|uniref:hypothetical protein n=1 Tax=uncultured Kushneria sp. TaxID=905033 RepID=UPI002633E627|nr:hypothetical protein [uncultured Kushneria sp.]